MSDISPMVVPRASEAIRKLSRPPLSVSRTLTLPLVVSEGNRYRSLALAGTVPKGLDFLRLDFGIIGVCVILWDATISGGLLTRTFFPIWSLPRKLHPWI